MTTTATTWTTENHRVAGLPLRLRKGGTGEPLVLLHHDIGLPEDLPCLDALARRFTVYAPTHPGYDGSERPDWMRSVRDIAVLYQGLLAELGLPAVTLVGLGFGGWIAAEMASMAPRAVERLALVGAMGLRPGRGEIFDQALVSYIDYVRAGFASQGNFDRIFGADPPTAMLERWDLNREMTFRIAWKPYMYSQTLPHLLGVVRAPALVVWGREDRIVPLACGEQYARALRGARLTVVEGAGHFVEMEQPDSLARLVIEHATGR